jgi:hypothetical protein
MRDSQCFIEIDNVKPLGFVLGLNHEASGDLSAFGSLSRLFTTAKQRTPGDFPMI